MESGSNVDTVTILFTDIEGSTSLWVQHPREANEALAHHDELLAQAVAGSGGRVVKTTGDGVMAVFRSIRAGVDAAVAAQLALREHEGTLLDAGRVRMGLHVGAVEKRLDDYFGLAVNECQRLMSLGHAGQILLSEVAATLVKRDLPPGCTLSSLGQHQLRGIPEPEGIFQLVHPELPSDFAPLGRQERPVPRLPEQLTSFVGRTAELDAVTDLLSAHRLVTLTGPGGAGKTRLATKVGSRSQDLFPDGIWMEDLAATSDPDLVPRHMAAALGIQEEPNQGGVEALISFLEARTGLLIMDNCEHVVDAAAELIEDLLQAAPNLRVLATSRERLRVPGEAIYVVPPLNLPPGDAGFDEVADYDAVQLFCDRATLVKSGFAVTPANAPALISITRHLDGIPLAIELAAAQVGVMSPAQIADNLDDRLRLLTAGARTAPRRQQTLQAAIDWSYDRLGHEEQQLLARLAVFNGGFDSDAVEAVCGSGEFSTFPVLMELVEKSMLARDGEADRVHLLETMRQYALERLLENDEVQSYAQRHAHYFADVLADTGGQMFGPLQASWLDRLSLERHNLLAAMSWSLDAQQPELLLRLVAGAWPFWLLRGYLAEGREWLERALEATEGGGQPLRAVALLGAGGLAANQGDVAAAEKLLQAARDGAGPDDSHTAGAALAQLAGLAHKRGDLQEATSLFRQALSLSRSTADHWTTGHILASLSLLVEDQGHHDEAQALAAEGVELSRSTGNPDLIADTLLTAGEIAINRDDQTQAKTLLDEALGLAQAHGLEIVDAWARVYLGKLACRTGDVRAGRIFLQEGLELFEDLSNPMGMAWTLRHLAKAEVAADDPNAAEASLVNAIRLAQEFVRPEVPLILEALGELHAGRGDFPLAATLLSAARSLSRSLGVTIPEPDRQSLDVTWGEIESRLDGPQLQALGRQAAGMTLDEAVLFAVKNSGEPDTSS